MSVRGCVLQGAGGCWNRRSTRLCLLWLRRAENLHRFSLTPGPPPPEAMLSCGFRAGRTWRFYSSPQSGPVSRRVGKPRQGAARVLSTRAALVPSGGSDWEIVNRRSLFLAPVRASSSSIRQHFAGQFPLALVGMPPGACPVTLASSNRQERASVGYRRRPLEGEAGVLFGRDLGSTKPRTAWRWRFL